MSNEIYGLPESLTQVSLTRKLKSRIRDFHSYTTFKLRSYQSALQSSLFPVQVETLSACQKKIVVDLKSTGFAKVEFDELFSLSESLPTFKNELETKYLDFRHSSTSETKVNRYQQSGSTRKEYLILCYGNGSVISRNHPLVRFCHSPEIQNTLKVFFKEKPRLTAMDYWTTLPAVQETLTGSQRWHRDHEDQKLVKIFVYLSDVDAASGPTEYIEGSFYRGLQDIIPPKRAFVLGDYLNEAELSQRGLLQYRRYLIGLKWTIFFVNTSGIHRGGFGKKERAMINITFTSQASRFPLRFRLE